MNIGVHTHLFKRPSHPTISVKPLVMAPTVHLIGQATVASAIHLSTMVMPQWDTDTNQWDGLTALE